MLPPSPNTRIFRAPTAALLLSAAARRRPARRLRRIRQRRRQGARPAVSGDYGDKPKVTADKDGEAAARRSKSDVLVEGKGPKVAKGDLLVADYLGSGLRDGKVFDNSYDRGQPAGFAIGTGKVITGWDERWSG